MAAVIGAEPHQEAVPVAGDPYVRRRLSQVRRTDWMALVGAAASSLASTYLLFFVLTPLTGLAGFVAVAYLLFLAFYALLVSMDESDLVVADRIATVLAWTAATILFGCLAFILAFTVVRGAGAIAHLNFFGQDMTMADATSPLDVGGVKHAIVGTLEQIGIALAITVPLGLVCAVYLNEFPNAFSRFVRTIVEAMTALPSVVAGLFIYATFILMLGNGKCGVAAALALGVMMLPIIIRSADVVIRLVPANLREASYALGTSRWRTVWHVVLPTARSGLTTAVILGTARGIGETSPVLLTAGFTATLNANPLEGPQVSLPLLVFDSYGRSTEEMFSRAFGAATALLALVMLLFVAARLIGGRAPGHDTPRMARKRRRLSARDARRFGARASAVGLALVLIGLGVGIGRGAAPAYAEEGFVPISGSGSTWSQNALDQWRRNVVQFGMQINYEGSGSSIGRTQFRNGVSDFAVSEIPYGLRDNGAYDTPPDRGYAYMPIVAGGTAFMYNLVSGGQRVTNLRLSGEVIAKIFTGNITQWNDPAIQKDNPQIALPARPVVPVVRSDGSGSTAQLSTWLSKRYAGVWDPYCAAAGRSTPCGITSNFPVAPGSAFIAQPGSVGVAGYVKQEQNIGAITYVEYSYALNAGFPVAKVLNRSGYYVEPKAENVAVGLLKARINTTPGEQYLTQILDGVYDNADKRAYPLSSYSYMILPTKVEGSFNEDKGRTLGKFAYYFLCEGQQQTPRLGYSPLPINLVQAGLEQVRKIPGVDVQSVDIRKCNNPTFSASGQNTLALNAPYPAACDRIGKTQCSTGTGGTNQPTQPGTNQPTAGPSGGNNPTAAPGTTPGSTLGTVPGAVAPGAQPSAVLNPETGQYEQVAGGSAPGAAPVTATAISLSAAGSSGMQSLLMVLAGVLLLLVVLLPPLVSQYVAKGGRK